MYERSSLRYAHTTGFTSLIYTCTGEFILTCGSDGDIRIWRGIDDDDPSSNCLGEYVMCLAQKGDKLLASTDRNTVQVYTFPDMDLDGTLMRFAAPVVTIKIRENCVAAGSEDTRIKVVKEGEEPMELEGHKGPVLALDMHPKLMFLASVGGEGDLKIWNLTEGNEMKTISGLPKTNSFENAKYFGSPCFEPRNGDSLAYASGKEINVLSTSTWETKFSLRDEKINGRYTCCQFSTDGLLLAAGTDVGEISVFDFTTRQAKTCEAPSVECQSITCLSWNNKNNGEIAYCDASGQLGVLYPAGDDTNDDNIGKETDVDMFGGIEFAEEDNQSEQKTSIKNKDHMVDDEDDENAVSIEKLKNEIMSYAKADIPCDEDTKDSADRSRAESPSVSDTPYSKSFKQQSPFQPSATPTHLEHCYLVWNTIGIVTLHTDGTDGAIDVEFHDVSTHHSLHIPNYSGHNMASLSSSVLALASNISSKVVCITLSTNGNREWCFELPDCESVDAICATTKTVSLVTNMQFLRIFTVNGTQREIISIPGPVVCIAGYEDRILVCYHSAPSSLKQQNIQGMILQTTGLNIKCQNITIPLKPERQMAWLGFSDCGSPVFYDSMGLVQLFNLKSNCWYPICDTMKQSSSISNNYFVISLSERSQTLQAVLCRGTSYPMTTPRPMVQELPLQLPLCDIDSEKSSLEDSLLRANIMAMSNADHVVKETAIKLFALACRTEIEVRAKEIIETIACPDLLMLAVKYATKLRRIHLSDKLSEMLPHVEEQQAKELKEALVDQSLPSTPRYLLKAVENGSTHDSKKIAPKSIDLGSSRKIGKRFSFNNNSPSISLLKKSLNQHIPPTSSSEVSQENFSISDSLTPKESLKDEETANTRTPLNSVNPFASKRKIADVDKTILMSSEKLKFAKK